MTGREWIVNWRRWAVLGLTLALTLNLIPAPAAVPAAVLGLLILSSRGGWAAVLISLAVFGMTFFSLLNRYLGVSLTFYQVLLSGCMLFVIILPRLGYSAGFPRRRTYDYLVWVGLVWILMIIGYLTGPRSGYSSLFISYFLVYGTSFVLAGILAGIYSVRVEDVTLPSLLIFSCLFGQMNLTPLQMPARLDSYWGLRIIEGFFPIYHERLAGLLLVLLLIQITIAGRKFRRWPELLLGGLICLPVIWYSYTRQAIAAVLITAAALAARTLLPGDLLHRGRQKAGVLFLAAALAGSAAIWFFGAGFRADYSRAIEGRTSIASPEESRTRIWRDCWRYIEANPVFGYGQGWFARERGRREFDWPHNWFIEAWLEHGLAGLILFLIGSGFLVYPIIRPGNRIAVSWALAGLYWLLVSQLSGDIARNSAIFFFITIAVLGRSGSRRLLGSCRDGSD